MTFFRSCPGALSDTQKGMVNGPANYGQPHYQQNGYSPQQPYPQPYAPQTVWGVPLEPGERVIYYQRLTGIGERLFLFLIGILFLPILVGLLFLYFGVFYEQTHTRVYVITDRRIFSVTGTRKLKEHIRLAEITKIERVFDQRRGRRFIVGSQRNSIILRFEDHHMTNLELALQHLAQPHMLPSAQFDA